MYLESERGQIELEERMLKTGRINRDTLKASL